jgi:hypothetical protein
VPKPGVPRNPQISRTYSLRGFMFLRLFVPDNSFVFCGLLHDRRMGHAFLEERWLPKSVLCLRDYNANQFLRDLIAGITVGLVALPLAMAFATPD